MGENVTIRTPDGEFAAYLAKPGAEKAPAIVVLQEILGVNAVMRGITDELAAQGLLAVCPDLFWRTEPGIDITDGSPTEWQRGFALFNPFDVAPGGKHSAATVGHRRQHARSTRS